MTFTKDEIILLLGLVVAELTETENEILEAIAKKLRKAVQ